MQAFFDLFKVDLSIRLLLTHPPPFRQNYFRELMQVLSLRVVGEAKGGRASSLELKEGGDMETITTMLGTLEIGCALAAGEAQTTILDSIMID